MIVLSGNALFGNAKILLLLILLTISAILLQSLKTIFPIDVSPDGNVIDFKPLQFWKAPEPIVFNEFGSSNCRKFEQFWKAELLIYEMPSFIFNVHSSEKP